MEPVEETVEEAAEDQQLFRSSHPISYSINLPSNTPTLTRALFSEYVRANVSFQSKSSIYMSYSEGDRIQVIEAKGESLHTGVLWKSSTFELTGKRQFYNPNHMSPVTIESTDSLRLMCAICGGNFIRTSLKSHMKICIEIKLQTGNVIGGVLKVPLEKEFPIDQVMDKKQVQNYNQVALKLYQEFNLVAISGCLNPDCDFKSFDLDKLQIHRASCKNNSKNRFEVKELLTCVFCYQYFTGRDLNSHVRACQEKVCQLYQSLAALTKPPMMPVSPEFIESVGYKAYNDLAIKEIERTRPKCPYPDCKNRSSTPTTFFHHIQTHVQKSGIQLASPKSTIRLMCWICGGNFHPVTLQSHVGVCRKSLESIYAAIDESFRPVIEDPELSMPGEQAKAEEVIEWNSQAGVLLKKNRPHCPFFIVDKDADGQDLKKYCPYSSEAESKTRRFISARKLAQHLDLCPFGFRWCPFRENGCRSGKMDRYQLKQHRLACVFRSSREEILHVDDVQRKPLCVLCRTYVRREDLKSHVTKCKQNLQSRFDSLPEPRLQLVDVSLPVFDDLDQNQDVDKFNEIVFGFRLNCIYPGCNYNKPPAVTLVDHMSRCRFANRWDLCNEERKTVNLLSPRIAPQRLASCFVCQKTYSCHIVVSNTRHSQDEPTSAINRHIRLCFERFRQAILTLPVQFRPNLSGMIGSEDQDELQTCFGIEDGDNVWNTHLKDKWSVSDETDLIDYNIRARSTVVDCPFECLRRLPLTLFVDHIDTCRLRNDLKFVSQFRQVASAVQTALCYLCAKSLPPADLESHLDTCWRKAAAQCDRAKQQATRTEESSADVFVVPFANHLHKADPEWNEEQLKHFNREARFVYEKYFRCPYLYQYTRHDIQIGTESSIGQTEWVCSCNLQHPWSDQECRECGRVRRCKKHDSLAVKPRQQSRDRKSMPCLDCMERCKHTFDFLTRVHHLRTCRYRPRQPQEASPERSLIANTTSRTLMCVLCARYFTAHSYHVHLKICKKSNENLLQEFFNINTKLCDEEKRLQLPTEPPRPPGPNNPDSDFADFNGRVIDNLWACPWCELKGPCYKILKHVTVCSNRREPASPMPQTRPAPKVQALLDHFVAPVRMVTSTPPPKQPSPMILCLFCLEHHRPDMMERHLYKCERSYLSQIDALFQDQSGLLSGCPRPPSSERVLAKFKNEINLIVAGSLQPDESFNQRTKASHKSLLPLCKFADCNTVLKLARVKNHLRDCCFKGSTIRKAALPLSLPSQEQYLDVSDMEDYTADVEGDEEDENLSEERLVQGAISHIKSEVGEIKGRENFRLPANSPFVSNFATEGSLNSPSYQRDAVPQAMVAEDEKNSSSEVGGTEIEATEAEATEAEATEAEATEAEATELNDEHYVQDDSFEL